MRLSSLLALGLIALLLAGAILLIERFSPGTADRLAAQRRVLPGFDRDRIDTIELHPTDHPSTVLRRTGPVWRIAAPFACRADQEAVERLLSAAEFLEPVRSVGVRRNPRQLGLAPPAARVVFGAGTGRLELQLGRIDASGQGVYLRRGQSLLVVERGFFDAINQPPLGLRDHRLLAIPAPELQRIELPRPEDPLRLKRIADGWNIESRGVEVRAVAPLAEELVSALLFLRARRFVAHGPAEPTARVVLVAAGKQNTLRLGGSCPGRPDERLVAHREASRWFFSCVDHRALGPLAYSVAQLQDRAPTDVQESQLKKILLRVGRRRLELVRQAGSWRLDGHTAVDGQQLRAWLGGLRAWRGSLEPATPAQLSALRLGAEPWGQIRFVLEEGGQRMLVWGASTPGGPIPLRRGREAAVLWLPKAAGASLNPGPQFLMATGK